MVASLCASPPICSKTIMENHPSNGKKAMEQELIRGRDMANQLLEVLVDKSNIHLAGMEGSILPFAEDIVRKMLRSFTNSLLLFNTNYDSNEVGVPATIGDFFLSTSCQKPEDMDETCKSLTTKNRRGCYKRSKRSMAPTWEYDSSFLTEDGYTWRKYGQKMTMNAKYHRSYYRCTHKNDEGCQAIKQVQRIQEDPPLYRTTYNGHHTCKSSLHPEITLDPASSSASSIILSFNNSLPSKQELPLSSPLFASTKPDPMEVIHDDHIAHNQLFSSDYLRLCDYELDFDYSRHVTMLSSTESVEYDNVYGRFGF